jgi:hypothetical protein
MRIMLPLRAHHGASNRIEGALWMRIIVSNMRDRGANYCMRIMRASRAYHGVPGALRRVISWRISGAN